MTDQDRSQFRHADSDWETARAVPDTPQTRSPAYRLAFADGDFMLRRELRSVRLQLELMKFDLLLDEAGIDSTVVLFGGARIKRPEEKHSAKTPALAEMSRFYDEARAFSRAMTEKSLATGGREYVIATGGGPGVMEAGNRGADDAGGRSLGLNIVLPHEQAPNEFVTPDLAFNFHYFAIRKMHFLMRARAVCAFPGGFGTMDELFETLTLVQTGRMKQVPILLFGRDFWERVVNWEALVEAGTIAQADLDLFRYVESSDEAIEIIEAWGTRGPREVIPDR